MSEGILSQEEIYVTRIQRLNESRIRVLFQTRIENLDGSRVEVVFQSPGKNQVEHEHVANFAVILDAARQGQEVGQIILAARNKLRARLLRLAQLPGDEWDDWT